MKARISESRYTLSINLPTSLYQKLINRTERGKIGAFIREMLKEKLKGEDPKEELKKRLIEAYKREAESKEVQKEMAIWEGVAGDNKNDE